MCMCTLLVLNVAYVDMCSIELRIGPARDAVCNASGRKAVAPTERIDSMMAVVGACDDQRESHVRLLPNYSG